MGKRTIPSRGWQERLRKLEGPSKLYHKPLAKLERIQSESLSKRPALSYQRGRVIRKEKADVHRNFIPWKSRPLRELSALLGYPGPRVYPTLVPQTVRQVWEDPVSTNNATSD